MNTHRRLRGPGPARTAVLSAALLCGSAAVPAHARAQDSTPGVGDTAYVAGEYRVFTGTGEPATVDDIVRAMGDHQVVFIGEAHDDPTAHMLEAELLRRAFERYGAGEAADAEATGLDETGRAAPTPRPIALSLEFFERDVQLVVDEYVAGLIAEKSFRRDSRPWPRYETDYRPLIEFAKENRIPVIAANAPRRYATRVTLHGRESLGELSPEALALLPPLPYRDPSEAYKNQWIQTIAEVMEEEGKKCGVPVEELAAAAEGEKIQAPAPVGSHQNMGNQLYSQVLWDASMGYRISEFLATHPDALVLHMVGGFHVERGTGTPEHLEAYRPGTSRMIVDLRPVEEIDTFEPAPDGDVWGDFVIQTDESHTLEKIECRRLLAGRKAEAE